MSFSSEAVDITWGIVRGRSIEHVIYENTAKVNRHKKYYPVTQTHLKMMQCLKFMSRTVHEEHRGLDQKDKKRDDDHDDDYANDNDCASASFTVWNKSVLLSCNGFVVIDLNGDQVYRVDNYYNERGPKVIVLMDSSGKPIFSVRRHPKKLRLLENWIVYGGDISDDYCATKSSKAPLFYVEKKHNRLFNGNSNLLARVYQTSTSKKSKRHEYMIEGSYLRRSCKVLDDTRKVVVEMKKKEAVNGVGFFGVDVFVLIVRPGFDRGFAMVLVLLLDQMF